MSFDALISKSVLSSGLESLSDEQRHELALLEKDFIVDAAKLKEISQRFEEELQEGLESEKGNIPMNVTWVFGYPTGNETGSFLTTDLGGTNLRVCWVELGGRNGETKVTQDSYRIPDDMKSGEAEPLWDFIAESLGTFVKDHDLHQEGAEPLPLGFTFSFPVTQNLIDHGVLQRWTKGFDIQGAEGSDAAGALKKAMEKKKLPIKMIALINDTVGAMIASAYRDPDTFIGAIFGTGCNAAYMETCGAIPKLSANVPSDRLMAINCEYGAFDNALRVLPRTRYDETVDVQSPRPGQQSFEKLSAGLYLGEIFRLVVLHMYEKGVLLQGQDVSKLHEAYSLDTGVLSTIETDTADLKNTHYIFRDQLQMSLSPAELAFCHRVAELIGTRSARLCTCGVAAICHKTGTKSGHVAADGSVANKHPRFPKRWAEALAENLDWPSDRSEDPVQLRSAEDGSGFGAAVIAAMTLERAKKGDRAGISDD